MKIYKIARCLPLDEIPTYRGESLVDLSLDYDTIVELDEQYHFKRKLGSGEFGVAYETFDGKVVKITTDEKEFETAEYLVGDNWQKYAPFARVYKARPLYGGLYLIIKDLVRPLDEDEQALWLSFLDEYESCTENIEGDHPDMLKLEKFEEYIYDVQNYGFADVLNPGNIGWDKDGNLVSFDPRQIER